jgi:hypothetical protein
VAANTVDFGFLTVGSDSKPLLDAYCITATALSELHSPKEA